MRIDQPVYSVRRWRGLRSEYSWLPPDGSVTTTAPNQIGVSFSAHDHVGHVAVDRTRYLDIPPGAVFANGSYEVHRANVRQPTEALEIYPDADQLSGVGLTASCTTNVRGYHRVGDATWMVAGRYVMRLERAERSDRRIAALTPPPLLRRRRSRLVDVAIKRAVEGAGRAARSGQGRQ